MEHRSIGSLSIGGRDLRRPHQLGQRPDFHPGGRVLATGSADQSVHLVDLSDVEHPRPLAPPITGHTNAVHTTEFDHDGTRLVSGSVDGSICLWDLTDQTHPIAFGRPLRQKRLTVITAAPAGGLLAIGSPNELVQLWTLDLDVAVRRICESTSDTLTEPVWRRYVSEDIDFAPPCGT